MHINVIIRFVVRAGNYIQSPAPGYKWQYNYINTKLQIKWSADWRLSATRAENIIYMIFEGIIPMTRHLLWKHFQSQEESTAQSPNLAAWVKSFPFFIDISKYMWYHNLYQYCKFKFKCNTVKNILVHITILFCLMS